MVQSYSDINKYDISFLWEFIPNSLFSLQVYIYGRLKMHKEMKMHSSPLEDTP